MKIFWLKLIDKYNIIYYYNIKGVFMSYLLCDQCGGYYELQPGDIPEDFNDICECGGNLKYVQNLSYQKICPDCGNITDDNIKICPICGFKFNKLSVTNKERKSRSVGYSPFVKSILFLILVPLPFIILLSYIFTNFSFPNNYNRYFTDSFFVIYVIIFITIYFIKRKNTVF